MVCESPLQVPCRSSSTGWKPRFISITRWRKSRGRSVGILLPPHNLQGVMIGNDVSLWYRTSPICFFFIRTGFMDAGKSPEKTSVFFVKFWTSHGIGWIEIWCESFWFSIDRRYIEWQIIGTSPEVAQKRWWLPRKHKMYSGKETLGLEL